MFAAGSNNDAIGCGLDAIIVAQFLGNEFA